MKTIDFSYFIERYNAGEMSNSERQWFQKELNGNVILRDEVKLWKRTDEVLENQDILSLRNKLSNIEKSRKEVIVNAKKVKKMPLYIKYASLVAGLVLIGGIVTFSSKKMTNDEIIEKFYKPYEPVAVSRSSDNNFVDNYTLGLDYFDSHDYRTAAIYFSKIVESHPKYMESTFLYGVASFEDNKYPEAEHSFAEVIDNQNNMFIESAKWFLALCYVKTNEREKAIPLLKTINNEGGIYMHKAKKIIRKLK